MNNDVFYTQLYIMWPELEQFKEKIYIFASNYITNPLALADNIRAQKKLGKTKFLFYIPPEALMITYCIGIHEIADMLIDEINSTDFFYVSGGLHGQESYDKLAKEYNWVNKITILTYNFWEKFTNIPALVSIPSYKIKIKPKKFLCFNRIPRLHRIELLEHMFEHNLIDDAYYSFNKTIDFNYHVEDVVILQRFPYIHKNQHRLPLKLNLFKDCENPATLTVHDSLYFENSYFSVVTETKFHYQDPEGHGEYFTDDVFVTEKTIKPIVFSHPFIILAASGFLKELRNMGYKTFHPYIDETYDTIENDSVRFELIIKEIQRLCSKTDEEWLEWQTNVKEIVEFNNQVFLTKTDHRITTDVEKYFK